MQMTFVKIGSPVAVLLGVLLFATAWRAADQAEKATGLPLHPGLTVQQTVDSSVCRHKAHMTIYDAPDSATLAEYISWYRGHVKDAHYVHKVWSNRAQEMFYSADGLSGVSITGSPNGPGVFAVTYMKVSAPALTIAQMDAFSPSNSACK
jgi:hypothetical protein